jgi:hypothetical protein
MLATLEVIRDVWGSVEDYVKKECGLSDGEIQRIRRNMVMDASSLDQPVPQVPEI